MGSKPRLTGYRRQNGTMGIRNHVIILPLDDLSNAAAEAVAKVIPGTLALPHAFGRLQFGEDLELNFPHTYRNWSLMQTLQQLSLLVSNQSGHRRVADGIASDRKACCSIFNRRKG